jgi:peptide/nickel transport system ATP-binding protein
VVSGDDFLVVEGLSCSIESPAGTVRLIDDVSFRLAPGRTLGIVGESGSGKTMLVRAIMGTTPKAVTVTGRVVLDGTDVLSLPRTDRRRLLGRTVGMVFQNPQSSLNPVVPIGRQITEGLRYHHGIGRREARDRAVELLAQVGISDPAVRLNQYSFELSGGMCQRVTIAAALACEPQMLIADEATTALDVTVQKQILDLIAELQRSRTMSVVLISHDLGVVAGRSDDIAVMYAGQMVEKGPTAAVLESHRHRYTEALLQSRLELDSPPHSRVSTIAGAPPRPSPNPVGCRFSERCASSVAECIEHDPPLAEAGTGVEHLHRCIRPAGDDRASVGVGGAGPGREGLTEETL